MRKLVSSRPYKNNNAIFGAKTTICNFTCLLQNSHYCGSCISFFHANVRHAI